MGGQEGAESIDLEDGAQFHSSKNAENGTGLSLKAHYL